PSSLSPLCGGEGRVRGAGSRSTDVEIALVAAGDAALQGAAALSPLPAHQGAKRSRAVTNGALTRLLEWVLSFVPTSSHRPPVCDWIPGGQVWMSKHVRRRWTR